MIACFAIAAGAATFADSVRLSEDVARRRHRTTAHSHGETATASGARRILVRVGGTPWTRSRPERYRRQRRDPPPGLLRGGENAGLNPRTRRPEDRYRYERTMPLLAGLYGSRRKGTAPSSIGGAADPWLRGHSGGPRRCPFNNCRTSKPIIPPRDAVETIDTNRAHRPPHRAGGSLTFSATYSTRAILPEFSRR